MEIVAGMALIVTLGVTLYEAQKRREVEDKLERTRMTLARAEKEAAKLRRENVVLHVKIANGATEENARLKELEDRCAASDRVAECRMQLLRSKWNDAKEARRA